MQQLIATTGFAENESKSNETPNLALAQPVSNAGTLAEVAHEARNVVTALGLYCDLLEEPGVLSPAFRHYGEELKLLAATSRQLVGKLIALDPSHLAPASDGASLTAATNPAIDTLPAHSQAGRYWETLPTRRIDDMAFELQSNRNLLAAMAGSRICLTMDISGGALPVRMAGEDLTRILVNLTKNAVEAMPKGGRLHMILGEASAAPNQEPWLVLNIEDNGPGIPLEEFERIFEAGYSTRTKPTDGNGIWRGDHQGLGLSITRSIVESAGGRIHAANRDPQGACFQIELPVRTA
jgi:signal transduction histidine kinase